MGIKYGQLFLICLLGIILATGPVSAAAKKTPDLESQLRHKINGFQGKVGIYIKDLTTGKEISINGNEVFPTASTSKIIVTLAAYRYPDRIPADNRANIPALVSDMIIYSSNEAFWELAEQLGSPTLETTCRELGLRNTAIHNDAAYQRTGYHSITTPRDMGKALESLLSGRYIGHKNSKTVLGLMEKGVYNEEIPRLLPPNTQVAHKPGELDDILCDAGIVFNARRPYLISVYTKSDEGSAAASDMIANIAAITDKHFSSQSHRALPDTFRRNIP